MKKLFILMLLTIVPLVSNAQRVDKPGEPYEYHCIVHLKRSCIEIEFASETCVVVDENGQEIKLSMKTYSYPDVLLFMSKRGWKHETGSLYDTELTFKKEVTSDEQIKEGFRLKTISSREGISPLLKQE